MTCSKRQLERVIDEVVYNDKLLTKAIDVFSFKDIYFNKVIKRLKNDSGKYQFTRDEYQTSVSLYFYKTQEKNIFNILTLCMIERKLFDR